MSDTRVTMNYWILLKGALKCLEKCALVNASNETGVSVNAEENTFQFK